MKHRQPGYVMAVQFDFALVGFDEAGDHVENGGLAGAIWPQQPHCLAPSHRKAHVLHHHSAAIALAEVMDGQNALSGRRGRRLLQSCCTLLAAQPSAPARRCDHALARNAAAH